MRQTGKGRKRKRRERRKIRSDNERRKFWLKCCIFLRRFSSSSDCENFNAICLGGILCASQRPKLCVNDYHPVAACDPADFNRCSKALHDSIVLVFNAGRVLHYDGV